MAPKKDKTPTAMASTSSEVAGLTAPGKRAAGVTADSDENPSKVLKPMSWNETLPSHDVAEDAMLTMRHIIPQVIQKLPEALASRAGSCNAHVISDCVYQVQPLAIKAKIGDGEISSYKDPWSSEICLHAVTTTGLYEAAVNICWLDALQQAKLPFDLPMDRPAWSTVHQVYEIHFSKNANQPA